MWVTVLKFSSMGVVIYEQNKAVLHQWTHFRNNNRLWAVSHRLEEGKFTRECSMGRGGSSGDFGEESGAS